MKVLVACEESQAVTMAFRELGHEAFSCDLLECSGGHPEWHIMGDVEILLNGRCSFTTQDGEKHSIDSKWDLLIGFPPCTYLTNAGACRLFQGEDDGGEYRMINVERLKKGIQGRDFFMKVLNADCDRIAVENPVPTAIYALPPYTQVIQPWMFGHPFSKRTCLWLKNLPKLQATNVVEPQISWVSGGSKKADGTPRDNQGMTFRDSFTKSKTFPGVAKAMAEQWTGQYQVLQTLDL